MSDDDASCAHTDPTELIEVFDAAGQPTGVAKTRAAIHRDGDWHLTFFCWIFREAKDGTLEVVLQKRAPHKDVWPGRYDASAAGHVRFGETTAEAAREIEEELGLRVSAQATGPDPLVPIMRHQQEHRHSSGLVDREIHDVHLLRCALPLEDYRPGPEVSGLCAVPIHQLIELARRMRESIASTLVTFDPAGTAHHEAIRLGREHLVPYDEGYFETIASYCSGRASMARR